MACRPDSCGGASSGKNDGNDDEGGTAVKDGNGDAESANDSFERTAGHTHSATSDSLTAPRTGGKNECVDCAIAIS